MNRHERRAIKAHTRTAKLSRVIAMHEAGHGLNSDCVEGVRSPLIHQLKRRDGVHVLQKDFLLDRDQRADRVRSMGHAAISHAN